MESIVYCFTNRWFNIYLHLGAGGQCHWYWHLETYQSLLASTVGGSIGMLVNCLANSWSQTEDLQFCCNCTTSAMSLTLALELNVNIMRSFFWTIWYFFAFYLKIFHLVRGKLLMIKLFNKCRRKFTSLMSNHTLQIMLLVDTHILLCVNTGHISLLCWWICTVLHNIHYVFISTAKRCS